MGYRWNNDNTIDFLLIQAEILSVFLFRFGSRIDSIILFSYHYNMRGPSLASFYFVFSLCAQSHSHAPSLSSLTSILCDALDVCSIVLIP